MAKPKTKINIIDCLGGVFQMDLLGYEYINTEAQRIIEAENPKRSIHNQQATKNYLIEALTQVVDSGNDLILVGTNGEVQTAQCFKPERLKLHSSFSKTPGTISTIDKWLYARELEKQGYIITLYSDKVFATVYNALRLLSGSWIKVVSLDRNVEGKEKPNTAKVMVKALAKYWAHI
jgi:hypothetical protein